MREVLYSIMPSCRRLAARAGGPAYGDPNRDPEYGHNRATSTKTTRGQAQGQPIPGIGKICIGSFKVQSDDDDWYWVDLSANQTIVVLLSHIPDGDDYALYLH